MNKPHDPNVTTDIPSAPADSLRAADSLGTVVQTPGSASTAGSQPGADARAFALPTVPGYRVVREIARGGMGQVLAAFDLVLDRDVALKTLLPGANADRFVRESKITARLPHPGIPPVYALGTLADGSPFLAMKLVAGQTLADEMKTADRSRLLQAFTQVCQAVGFAHSRGVIHRDLKPANVMVGAFGEVQVMDWGLAKVLTSEEVPDQPRSAATLTGPTIARAANQTTDRGPFGEYEERTHAGQVLGTPAYMAPEQARGEATDARADVFALGGILCAILTGQSPFSGRSSLEVVQRARDADLADAHARLDGCGADAELITLCRRCLSPSAGGSPGERPGGGRHADGLLNGVRERLQVAERERAVALAREAEQRKRRRVLVGSAVSVFAVMLAGVGVSLWQAQKAIEARKDADAKAEAARLAESKEREANREVRAAFERSERDRQVADESYRTAREAVVGVADRLPELLRKSLFARQAQQQVMAALGDAVGKQTDMAAARSLPARTMMNFHVKTGELAAASGDWAKADAAYAAAQEITTGLLREDAAEKDKAKGNHALVLQRRATHALSRRDKPVDVDAVLALFREALDLQRQVVQYPTTGEIPAIEAKQSVAGTLYEIADTYRRTQKFADGIAAGEEALALRREVAAAPPTTYTTGAERKLTESLVQLGKMYTALANDAKAEPYLKEAAERLAKLAAADASDQGLMLQAARASREYGDFLLMRGRLADAAPRYAGDLSLVKKILTTPELILLQSESSDVYYRTATLALKRGDRNTAAADYRRCRDIRQMLAEAVPANDSFQSRLANALARCGDHARAAGILEQLLAKRPDAELFNMGCNFALCADAVRDGRPTTELLAAEKTKYDRFRDRAMDLLEKLAAGGWKDAVKLATDPDLDPLRDHPKFEKLVSRLTPP